MKNAASFVLAALIAASGMGSTYYALELKGGFRLLSLDRPIRKGRVVLFHRYPDGTYMSLAAGEVENVVATEEASKPERLSPGQTVFIGPAVEGPGYSASPAAAAVPSVPADSGYGYDGWYWGGGYFPPAPRPPGPAPVSPATRIGPNGFPILAPPGSPGSTPPRIGPNGFPILAPQPPVPPPLRRP